MSTKAQFASGFSWNTLTVVLQSVIQLVYVGIMNRLIEPESFALLGVALSLIGFAEIFSQIGFGPALIQRKEVNQNHLNGAFFSSVGLGLLFTLGFICASPFISRVYAIPDLEKIIQVISLSFLIAAIGIVPRSMLFKAMNFKKFFLAAMISIIGGNLIIGLTLAYLGWDIWAYVFALLSQNVLMVGAIWLLNPVRITMRWDKRATLDLVRYGSSSTLFNSLNYLATRLDTILLPKLVQGQGSGTEGSLDQAGIYERSTHVMLIPITLMGKLSDNVLFSGISLIQDDIPAVKKTFLTATYAIFLIMFPASIFVIAFADDLVAIYLGKDFETAGHVVQILFVAVAFRSLIKLCDSVLRALDEVLRGSAIKGLFLILIAMGTWIGWGFGLAGVAAGIVIATLVQYIVMIFFCQRLLHFSLKSWLRKMSPGVILALVIGLASFGLKALCSYFSLPSLVTLLLALIGLGILLLVLLKLTPFLFAQGKDNLPKEIIGRLPNRGILGRVKKGLSGNG